MLAFGCVPTRGVGVACGLGAVAVTTLALAACTPPPEAMPPPERRPTEAVALVPLRDAPWNATPPDRLLPVVPGAAAPAEVHPAARRTAVLATTLLDSSIPIDERTEYLLERARDRLAVGGYGLPLTPDERWLLAQQAVIFFEVMHPEIAASLDPPWAYRRLDVDAFKRLPPEAMLGWQEALRLDDLPSLLASGGSIVLLSRSELAAELPGPSRSARQRKGWALLTVWLPDQSTLAALHVVALHPGQAHP